MNNFEVKKMNCFWKNVFFLLSITILSGCNSESAPDCFQTSGNLITKEIDLPPFEEIRIFENVKLYVAYGNFQKVEIKTGENLLTEVEFSVENNKLSIKNKNTCNLIRDYKMVKVYVTSNNLKYIKNGSQWIVESTNILKYPELKLVTEISPDSETTHTDGGFDLTINCEQLTIVNNGMASYYLSGEAKNMFAGFYSNDGRLEAQDLSVQHLRFYHRSSNSFLVNPQMSLRGEIRSTGDVISFNRPAIVDVEEFYTGRLIFKND